MPENEIVCRNPYCDDGTVHEVLFYRQPPPGNAVFEKGYHRPPGSSLLEIHVDRPCTICWAARRREREAA